MRAGRENAIRLRPRSWKAMAVVPPNAITSMTQARVQDPLLANRWAASPWVHTPWEAPCCCRRMPNDMSSTATKSGGYVFRAESVAWWDRFSELSAWASGKVSKADVEFFPVVVHPAAMPAAPSCCLEAEPSKTWRIRYLSVLQARNVETQSPHRMIRIVLPFTLRSVDRGRRHSPCTVHITISSGKESNEPLGKLDREPGFNECIW